MKLPITEVGECARPDRLTEGCAGAGLRLLIRVRASADNRTIVAQRGLAAATKIGGLTPHPSAHGRHPLPTGEGGDSPSFSLGEKVAEERGRMRGLVIQKMFAKKNKHLRSCIAEQEEKVKRQSANGKE